MLIAWKHFVEKRQPKYVVSKVILLVKLSIIIIIMIVSLLTVGTSQACSQSEAILDFELSG